MIPNDLNLFHLIFSYFCFSILVILFCSLLVITSHIALDFMMIPGMGYFHFYDWLHFLHLKTFCCKRKNDKWLTTSLVLQLKMYSYINSKWNAQSITSTRKINYLKFFVCKSIFEIWIQKFCNLKSLFDV